MIKTEIIEINGRQFIKSYSDAGLYIERDGIKYMEAVDPIKFKDVRIYTETEEKVVTAEELKRQEELRRLEGYRMN